MLVAIFVIGTTRPINMGLLGIMAAFIVGTAAGVSEDDIFAGFPGDLFIILVGITFLFALARNNGTVDWLVAAAVRMVRGRVSLIPWVFFAVTGVLTAVGSVVPAAVAIIVPIALSFAMRFKINPVLMGLMVINGATAGGFSPISIFGSIVNGVVEGENLAFNPTLLFLSSLVFNFLLSIVVFFMFGGRELLDRRIEQAPSERFAREPEAEKPLIGGGSVDALIDSRLDRDKVITLVGIGALVVLALARGEEWDVGFVAVSIAVILSLAMPQSTKGGRSRQGRVVDGPTDLRDRHLRLADRRPTGHDRLAR